MKLDKFIRGNLQLLNNIMKKGTLLLSLIASALFAFAQTPATVNQIKFVSATDLANCTDTSAYFGQIVKTVGIVIQDGNLTEIPSGSVNGGYRPEVYLLDTATGATVGGFNTLAIHGVYEDGSGNNQPVATINNLVSGMIVEVTGTISRYQGQTQMTPSDNSSVNVISTTAAPSSVTVSVGDLNDNQRVNQMASGEQYESGFVEIQNVTVTSVNFFSGGSRVSFDVTDGSGNVINVSDRFLVQKLPGHTSVNPNSPASSGAFVAPVVGTLYASLKGIVLHSENGCTGGTGRGYELNPFDTSHYQVGITPPSISNITRTPLVPGSSDAVVIRATIQDFDGTLTGQNFYYSTNLTDPYTSFTSAALAPVSGSTSEFEATIPAQANGTVVRYYIDATDNDAQTSFNPFGANSTTNPDFHFYTVNDGGLSIVDIQKVLNVNNDNSPYLGSVVTVTGCVTASAKAYDLESVYIQDATATKWAGIRLVGNSDLTQLWRTEEVTITGLVEESFGFTQISASTVTPTGNTCTINPVSLSPTDSAFFASNMAEEYESMLVTYENTSGKVWISNGQSSPFGEYTVAVDSNNSFWQSAKVQAGIRNNNNASSLWVSLVSDTALATNDGLMEVPAVKAEKGMSMDAITGILYYGFGQYELKPRNNDDIVGLNVALDSANYADTSSASAQDLSIANIALYPNPANNFVILEGENLIGSTINILSINGQIVARENAIGNQTRLNLSQLESGLYLIEVVTTDGSNYRAKFIKQ